MRARRNGRTPARQAEETLLGLSSRIDELEERAQAVAIGRDSPRFELVIVCTGNRFRSPLAAALVEQLVADLPVRVSSLGTLDLHGSPPLRAATKHATRLGLDLSAHRARTLLTADLRHADLVIGFERAHVGAAVLEARAPRERSFLLTELVELLEGLPVPESGDPVRRARAAVREAETGRREDEGDWYDEIPDPLGGSARLARQVAEDVQRLTVSLVRSLFGVEREPPTRRTRKRRWFG
jgi:protein-tyrosine phosphatase